MKSLLLSLVLLTAVRLPAAQVEEWLKSGLLHPDLIASVRDELALTEDQQARLNTQLNEARAQAGPLEQAVKEQKAALNHLLKDRSTSAEAAAAQLTRLLDAEAAVKQLQLRALISVRDVLTPEQLAKARKLGPPRPAEGGGLEARVDGKVHKLRAAVESLGVPPTQAMKYRGEEIEQLLKSGKLAEADAKLDELIKDSHVNELGGEAAAVDFSKYEPGSTDLETLRERFERLQAAGQEIISLPLLREMLQAKAAFEAAKEAQDAEKVGRILTYAEGKLQK